MGKRKSSKIKYIHEPKEVSRQRPINQLNVQHHFDLADDKTLASRKLIKKDIIWVGDSPKEFTKSIFNVNVAYMDCFFFTSYVCTHLTDLITRNNNIKEPYNVIYNIPVSKFCAIIGAKTYEEKIFCLQN
jgi:hypothetical protein